MRRCIEAGERSPAPRPGEVHQACSEEGGRGDVGHGKRNWRYMRAMNGPRQSGGGAARLRAVPGHDRSSLPCDCRRSGDGGMRPLPDANRGPPASAVAPAFASV